MPIEFRCEKCDKKLKVKDELAGKKIKCPGCREVTAVPAAAAAGQKKLKPEMLSSEAIVNLNLKKFKGKAIDLDEDEDLNLDELEGAVVLRKKRELEAQAGPPPEPLTPVDWVCGLLFGGFCCIYPIVLFVQGKRSRGMKSLAISAGITIFWIAVGVLIIVAANMGPTRP